MGKKSVGGHSVFCNLQVWAGTVLNNISNECRITYTLGARGFFLVGGDRIERRSREREGLWYPRYITYKRFR